MDTLRLAKEIEDYVIDIRRDLHEHPEISMEEERTINVVTSELKKMGIDYEIVPHGGVIGFIEGDQSGNTIVLRADLDALPMKEATDNLTQEKVVVSKNDEAAHMCGHDGHTAMLLGSAKILSNHKDQLKGNVLLAFEQGEEEDQGIYRILKRLVEIGADGVWGIHLKNDIPTGKISVDPGPRMAGLFEFDLIIHGKSGHGSRPDLAISPVACFIDFYEDLQAFRVRKLNPFEPITFSVGSIQAGSSANVIPDDLRFKGTARYLQEEQGEKGLQEFIRLLGEACHKHNCQYEFVKKPVPVDVFVYNDETCSEIAANSISDAIGKNSVTNYYAWMASEPFGFYQNYFPGVFAFVGIQNHEKGVGAEHHNAHFDIDEDALKYGVAATIQYTLDFLNYEKEITFDKETRDVKHLFKDMNFEIYEPEEKEN
ncbi:amidohydrolase [Pseudogracilibacillus sp. SE30717A]|uniref:amidohydrolase n=1 Tax=Pseudogracilibacillus sp. SE30717A TaxID=3098293 RepID=UPI00300DDE83